MGLLLLEVGSQGDFHYHSVASVEWWLDASDPTTVFDTAGMNAQLTTTGACGRILDKSGHGHDAMAVSSTKPTWTLNQQNGLAGLVGASSSYFDTLAANATLGSEVTIFAVCKVPAVAAYMQLIGGAANSFAARWTNDNPGFADIVLDGITDLGNASATVPATASLTMFQYSATGGAVYRQNGAANGTQAANGTMSGATDTFLAEHGGFSYFAQTGCVFLEMLVIKRIIGAVETSLIEAALNAKWALW